MRQPQWLIIGLGVMRISHFVNEVLESIWAERYRKNGETYEGNLHRVAKFCATSAQEKRTSMS